MKHLVYRVTVKGLVPAHVFRKVNEAHAEAVKSAHRHQEKQLHQGHTMAPSSQVNNHAI